jgi:hypothetical protein
VCVWVVVRVASQDSDSSDDGFGKPTSTDDVEEAAQIPSLDEVFSSHEVPGPCTRLDIMMHMWHKAMPLALLRKWLIGLRKLLVDALHCDKEPLRVGTACSGTGLTIKCVCAAFSYWKQHCNILLEVPELVLSVEKDKAKQTFLKMQHDMKFLMEDVAHLKNLRATNLVTMSTHFVPFPTILAAGFSCATRTKIVLGQHPLCNRMEPHLHHKPIIPACRMKLGIHCCGGVMMLGVVSLVAIWFLTQSIG